MHIGKVVGSVVSTHKLGDITGMKLLVIKDVDLDGNERDSFTVAIDTIGAGHGEMVLYVSGSSARLTFMTKDKPVDSAIIGIIDHWEVLGEMKYKKYA